MTFWESALLSAVVAFACYAIAASAAAEPPVVGPTVTRSRAPAGLPQLPPGVADIKFREFFEMPVGPRGLKPTRKLLDLDGKSVRLLGYMVHQEESSAGVFILSPVPVNMAEAADGPADDLPVTAVFVHVQNDPERPVAYTPGPLLLTGTLEVGPAEERDGRVSAVRLLIDAPIPEAKSVAR